MILVPNDEFRALWFVLNIPTVFIIMGRAAGIAAAAAAMILVPALSALSVAPMSPNAIVTQVMGTLVVTAIYHAYVGRAASAFDRLVALNALLRERATRDPLTDLLNARAYYEAADRWVAAASRSGARFSVLFVDLDHFKRINDEHGHEAGDAVLRSAAECLRSNVRAGDLVGRVGGEEFSIFLPDTGIEGAIAVGETLRRAIEDSHPTVGDARLTVTVSVGVAARLNGGRGGIAELQREADQAMYNAKRAGRNRVTPLG